MKCPHCNEVYVHPDERKICRNVESYGSSNFVVKCISCGSKINVYAEVRVTLHLTKAIPTTKLLF